MAPMAESRSRTSGKAAQRFVRMLVAGASVAACETGLTATLDGRKAVLDRATADALRASGVLVRIGDEWRASKDARTWLRRALISGDSPHADQHRTLAPAGDARINLSESPLARLATGAGGTGFLESHHIEAGERVRRLCERASMLPRLTMRYTAEPAGNSKAQGPADISNMAAEARRQLAAIHTFLPADCAGVVIDVCGLLKGLQLVETERGWPRRSAKLVLRIGLDQLARHYGLAPVAIGTTSGRSRGWMDEGARPDRFE
jgi:hypothetical protein